MRLAAVNKARALALIELDELNVGGKVRFADCAAPLVSRYDFKVFPTEVKDYDPGDKGIRFESGKAGGIVIDALVIYTGALYIDTFSNTTDSQNILLEMLEWGREELGLTYTPGMIRKWGYISHIGFYTDFPLLASMSSPIKKLSQKISGVTEKLWDGLEYGPTNLSIGHDPAARKHSIASFFIQHRINTRIEENRYFSEAPLPTDLHMKFLEEFEADVLESMK